MVSSLCKVNTFFFHSANLTDYFFTLQSEQKVKMFFFCSANLTDYLFTSQSEQKVKMFFFCSANLTDYLFTSQREQKVNRKWRCYLFLQCQFNKLSLYFAKWTESEQKVKMFFSAVPIQQIISSLCKKDRLVFLDANNQIISSQSKKNSWFIQDFSVQREQIASFLYIGRILMYWKREICFPVFIFGVVS